MTLQALSKGTTLRQAATCHATANKCMHYACVFVFDVALSVVVLRACHCTDATYRLGFGSTLLGMVVVALKVIHLLRCFRLGPLGNKTLFCMCYVTGTSILQDIGQQSGIFIMVFPQCPQLNLIQMNVQDYVKDYKCTYAAGYIDVHVEYAVTSC